MQSGGVKISGSHVNVGGDVVGRDKITTTRSGIGAEELSALTQQFAHIRQRIESRPADPDVDKAELKELVTHIEDEVRKGEAANPTKVRRWLLFLAETADDVFQVTAAALANPVAGVAKAVQLLAKRLKEELG